MDEKPQSKKLSRKEPRNLDMDGQPLVTVIIPVYNTERYLQCCVDSVLIQTYSNLEIILVDDGSTDGCPQICDEYAARDPRVQTVHQPNGGAGSARNAALDIARGEYYVFVDSDDYITPDFVEQLLYTLQASGAELAICGFTQDFDALQNGVSPDWDSYSSQAAIREQTLLSGARFEAEVSGKLYAKRLFQNMRFPEEIVMGEDFAIMYKIFHLAEEPIAYVDVKKYGYRANPDSIVHYPAASKNLLGLLGVREEFQVFVERHYPELGNTVRNFTTMRVVQYYILMILERYDNQELEHRLVRRIRDEFPYFLKSEYCWKDKLMAAAMAYFPGLTKRCLKIRYHRNDN